MENEPKHFERALDPVQARKLLMEICGDALPPFSAIIDWEIVKRHPGRRLVLRYELQLAGGSQDRAEVYCKLYRGRGGERAFAYLTALGDLGIEGIRFPRPIGYSTKKRCLVLEALLGDSLGELLREARIADELEGFGKHISVFHCREAARAFARRGLELPIHDAAAEVGVLGDAEQRFENCELAPLLLGDYSDCARLTRSALLVGAASSPRRLIHRDLYPEQVLCLDGIHGLLDLDTLSLGEPELDVGNFVAHLLLADLREEGEVRGAAVVEGLFLRAYALAGELNLSRVRIYAAATLLRLAALERLAHDSVSRLSWADLAAALLAQAKAELLASAQLSASRSGEG